MFLTDDQRRRLWMFDAKAEMLLRSGLKDGLAYAFGFDDSLAPTIVRTAPSDDSIESFVLNLRYFIQDGEERISFRALSDIYDPAVVPARYADGYRLCREDLNRYLDTPNGSILGEPKTPRLTLETFVYGGYAHADPRHTERFQRWRADPFIFRLAELSFLHVLGQLRFAVWSFQRMGQILLADSAAAAA